MSLTRTLTGPALSRPGARTGWSRGSTRSLTAWLGVVALTTAAVWLCAVGAVVLVQAGDLWPALKVAHGQMLGAALLVVVAALFLAERAWPAVPRPWLARAHRSTPATCCSSRWSWRRWSPCWIPASRWQSQRYARFLILSRLPFVPRVALVAVILVGIDAMNWLAHVANHRSTALWRLHALHHSQEDMSVFTTFRTHPLAHASYLPALVPALVLGASGTVPGAAVIVYSCLVTLPHANLRWTFGPLGRILVSPAYHRLHHASTPSMTGWR